MGRALACCHAYASAMSSGAERSVPAVGRPRLCWIIGLSSLRMRALLSSGFSKSANYSRDASRPPPWRRWSTSCRYLAWKTPLACGLSVYEGARLRSPAHERRASVTAGFAYARSAGSTALGRSHAVGAVGSDLRVGGRAPAPPQPTGGGRPPYKGVQQPPGLKLGAFSPHSHDMPASPALSLCLR